MRVGIEICTQGLRFRYPKISLELILGTFCVCSLNEQILSILFSQTYDIVNDIIFSLNVDYSSCINLSIY